MPVMHSLPVNYNSAVNRKFLRVTASATKPVLLTLREVGNVTFNGGTNQYRLGTTSGSANLLALRNTPAAQVSAEVQTLSTVLVADTDIWVGTNLVGTTVGQMYVCITLTELNVADVNANAIP